MPEEMMLDISPEGEVSFLGDAPELQDLGPRRKERASVVVPVSPGKAAIFTLLRRALGDDGMVATWTRSWAGPWRAVILSTGAVHDATTRAECLAWERQELEGTD